MSSGERIPLELACRLAADLEQHWHLEGRLLWVGSIRRGLATVGDIEACAALERPTDDGLFRTIDATLSRDGDLFAPRAGTVGQAVRGHKPGFREATYALEATDPPVKFRLQVFRAPPEGMGWMILMRTGPVEFGRAFLAAWKSRFEIAKGQQASVDGLLRDKYNVVVPAPTEADAFRLVGWSYFPPKDRDAVGVDLCRKWGIDVAGDD